MDNSSTPDGIYAADLDAIRAAHARIESHVHRTPTMTCSALDERAGRSLVFKCENFQRIGAFKIRGAVNAVLSLSDEAAARGVVTHSSGNHAQALALAARIRGIKATIVMPENAPRVKSDAVNRLGAEIIWCAPTQAARESAADEVVARRGATLVPPYDDPRVIAGQGTIALEFLADHPDLRAMIVPIGGGGMISGITIATKAINPTIAVIGAEPKAADDAARGKSSGERQQPPMTTTIADGLRTGLGALTWPVVRDLVDEVVTVEEEEIVDAMRFVFERMKLVIEPSAAVGVAAALGSARPILDRLAADAGAGPVGVVLCGGNVDLDRLPWQT